MRAIDFMKKVAGESFQTPGTVDCFKYGNPENQVTRVATCLTATPEVLSAASRWGADLIITHEPTFYEHTDEKLDTPVTRMKSELVEKCGIPICRFHDGMHFGREDMISEGFLRLVNWEGEFDGKFAFVLARPKSPLEIAREVEERLELSHVRIVGRRDGEVRKIGLFLGHRGDECWGDFKQGKSFELALGGEWCEWHDGEVIRDAAQFGLQLTAVMLGHAGSERAGMKALADNINRDFAASGIECRYIECGELFSYLD